jgi:hypothetical protein
MLAVETPAARHVAVAPDQESGIDAVLEAAARHVTECVACNGMLAVATPAAESVTGSATAICIDAVLTPAATNDTDGAAARRGCHTTGFRTGSGIPSTTVVLKAMPPSSR